MGSRSDSTCAITWQVCNAEREAWEEGGESAIDFADNQEHQLLSFFHVKLCTIYKIYVSAHFISHVYKNLNTLI